MKRLCPNCDLKRDDSFYIPGKRFCRPCRSRYDYLNKMGQAEAKALDFFRKSSKLWVVHSTGFNQNTAGLRQ